MSTISLCMIVKNEELVLDRCLRTAKSFVDEIIIVDTGSTDKTIEIAQKYTKNIYHFEWCNDFSKARNFAFSKAKSDYVMWLDADDVVPKITQQKLIDLKQNMNAEVYMLKYDIAFNGRTPTFSYFRERIIKNCSQAKFVGAVHECIVSFGKIERLELSIQHKKIKVSDSDRNYNIYKNLCKHRELLTREKYYFARELFDHKKYKQAINMLKKFVKCTDAWKENIIDAYFIMSSCYLALGDENSSFQALCSTFVYDKPRANICCHIGDYFLTKQDYLTAIYWYKTALTCEDVTHKGGFVQSIYYNYYPYLQLCVCYHKLGDNKKASQYNKKAGKYNKNSIAVEQNKKYFESMGIL